MPGWREVVESIHFYLHVHHSGVELRRFATGTNAALAFRDGRRVDTKVRFVAAQPPGGHKADAAVGFAVDVDLLVLNMSGELFERMSVAFLSRRSCAPCGRRTSSIACLRARPWFNARMGLSATGSTNCMFRRLQQRP